MYIPKRYGQSRKELCPFCGKEGIAMNPEGVPVCIAHKGKSLPPLKCHCGKVLMLLTGKFGVFGTCITCGNMNLKKAIEINEDAFSKQPEDNSKEVSGYSSERDSGEEQPPVKRDSSKPAPKEITIRSDDPDYFDD
jgi:hypothetical protein